MTTLWKPAPGAGQTAPMVASHAWMETKLLMRNGEQLVLALAIPLLTLWGGSLVLDRLQPGSKPAVESLLPGVIGLAIMSTAFTSLAIATGFDRRYGVIKWLGSTPLSRGHLLVGKALALLLVELLQIAAVVVAALALGWRPPDSGWVFATVLAMIFGTAAFAGLALAIAGVLRAEATLGLANLIYLGLAAAGGVVLPLSGKFGTVVSWLPSGALGDLLRAGFVGDQIPLAPLLVLAAWFGVGVMITLQTFKWE